MKHLKLFFACLLMAVLSIGQVWAKTTVTDQVNTFGQSTTPTGWTVGTSNTQDKDAYLRLVSGDYLQMTTATVFTSGEILSSDNVSVTVSCGTFGTWNTNGKSVKCTAELRKSDGTVLSSANQTFTGLDNKEGTYRTSISVSKPTDPSQIAYLRITFSDYGTTNAELRVKNVKLNYETDKATTSTPTLTSETTSLSFEAEANSTDQKQFTFSGANLTANAGLEITGDNASLFSVQPTSVNKGNGTITNRQVTVTYSPTAAGSHSATLTISSTGATSKTITLTGTATAPAVKHKAFFYNGETLLNTNGTEFAEGATVSYSGTAPTSCETGEGASTTFAGWATATWDGKVAKNAIVPNFYEGALPKMGNVDVTYYAVFCKGGAPTLATSIAKDDVVYLAKAANGIGVTGANTNGKDADVSTTIADWMAFTVENGSATGTWKLKNGSNYVVATAKNFAMGTSPNDLTFAQQGSTGQYRMIYNDGTDDYALCHNSNNGNYYRFYKTSNTASTYTWFYVFKASAGTNYMTTCSAALPQMTTPTIATTATPVNNKYTSAINVTITAEGADAIYYNIDSDDDPTTSSTLYEGAIELNTTGSHTIKAIAVKDGYANSNVASATYVLDLPYGSISEFIIGEAAKQATDRDVEDIVLTAEDKCVITGISINNSNKYSIYVQDASGKGIIIYENKTTLPHEHAQVGHQITGTLSGKYEVYNSQHELTNVVFTNATFSADPVERPTPAPVSAIDDTEFGNHTIVLVKIEDLYYKSSNGKTHKFAKEAGGSPEYTIYDQFGMLSGKVMPETDKQCDITGILSVYNSTYQLLPVLDTDIEVDADALAPVFTPAGGADEAHAVQVDLNSDVTIAAADANHTVNITTAKIDSEDPMSVTATSSRHFYRPTTVTKWYYGNAAAAAYDISGTGTDANGNEVSATVGGSAATTAVVGATVTVTIDVAEHFHFASIQVNNGVVSVTEVTAGEEYTFEMPEGNATIAVTYTEDAKATLTFAKGDANGTQDAPASITDYVGETVQMPANTFTYTGHKFIGWSCDNGTTKLLKDANYELAENKTFVAQWAPVPTFDAANHEWQLVTSTAQLKKGDYYLIASSDQGKVMSNSITNTNNSNYAGQVAAEIADGVIAYNVFGASNNQSADAAGVAVLQLDSTETAITFTEVVANEALLGATANKKIGWGSGTTTWSVTISGDDATIQNGTSANGRFLHNVNSTRFTTYTSDPTNTMLLPQLYVWAEKTYKLRYDANGGSNAPAAQVAVAGEATVTDAKPTAPTDKVFDKWNTQNDGLGTDKAAGDVIDLSSADVTLYAIWRDPSTFSISYDADGGTPMANKSELTGEDVTEGEAYTVEDNVYEKEGKIFTGWKVGDVTYNEGDEIYPTSDMTFVAQWSDPNITDFVLVTDVKQLKDGDKVYIVTAGNYNYAIGTQNSSSYRNRVEIAKSNDHVVELTSTPVEFTLGKSGSNFTLMDGTQYLYSTSAKSVGLRDTEFTWTITISEGIATIDAGSAGTLQYNASAPRFAAYTSTQQPVAIYKRPDYTRTVNGEYGTICLPKAGKMDGASLFSIAYYGATSKKIFFDEVVSGELEAGKPYIFLPNEGATQLGVYYSDNTADDVAAGSENGLIGFYNLSNPDATFNIPMDDGNYILYANQYWLVSGRAAYIANNRAYIKLIQIGTTEPQKAPGVRRVSMNVNGEQTATGVDNVQGDNVQSTKLLINGQLYILRGEKMYNANGQLVK